jgi:putative transposase
MRLRVCLRRLRLRLCGREPLGYWTPKSPDFGVHAKCAMTTNDYVFKTANNNPPHLFIANAIYMLTASTYRSQNIISTSQRKLAWISNFLKSATIYQWEVIAWVVLENHYHALVKSPDSVLNLSKFIGSYHKFTARQWNKEDGTPGRQVWRNYWDTCIRSEKDYANRLRYIFFNPVKHGLVERPEDYPFSNYKQFHDFSFGDISEVNDVPEF